jgi:hypothetical protein
VRPGLKFFTIGSGPKRKQSATLYLAENNIPSIYMHTKMQRQKKPAISDGPRLSSGSPRKGGIVAIGTVPHCSPNV